MDLCALIYTFYLLSYLTKGPLSDGSSFSIARMWSETGKIRNATFVDVNKCFELIKSTNSLHTFLSLNDLPSNLKPCMYLYIYKMYYRSQ